MTLLFSTSFYLVFVIKSSVRGRLLHLILLDKPHLGPSKTEMLIWRGGWHKIVLSVQRSRYLKLMGRKPKLIQKNLIPVPSLLWGWWAFSTSAQWRASFLSGRPCAGSLVVYTPVLVLPPAMSVRSSTPTAFLFILVTGKVMIQSHHHCFQILYFK